MSGIMMTLIGGKTASVSVYPPNASGGALTGGTVPSVTATPAGFVGAVTYAWTIVTTDTPLTINAPSSATTGFVFAGTADSDTARATVRVTATSGSQTAFALVSVVFRNTTPPGGRYL